MKQVLCCLSLFMRSRHHYLKLQYDFEHPSWRTVQSSDVAKSSLPTKLAPIAARATRTTKTSSARSKAARNEPMHRMARMYNFRLQKRNSCSYRRGKTRRTVSVDILSTAIGLQLNEKLHLKRLAIRKWPRKMTLKVTHADLQWAIHSLPLLLVNFILYCFRDIISVTVYLTTCDLEKSSLSKRHVKQQDTYAFRFMCKDIADNTYHIFWCKGDRKFWDSKLAYNFTRSFKVIGN